MFITTLITISNILFTSCKAPNHAPKAPVVSVEEKQYDALQGRIDELAKQAESEKEALMHQETSHTYPWDGLEEDLLNDDVDEITIIGYGSLVNPKSAARTLNEKESPKPVIAFGVDRIFNYNRKLDSLTKGIPDDPKTRANLNIRPNNDLSHVINGVAMKVSVEEIDALRKREIGYHLIPVIAVSWNAIEENEEPEFFKAYILSVPEYTWHSGRYLTSNSILPYPPYYNLSKEGAALFGEKFLAVWLHTTYLADGKTTVAQWEKAVCDNPPDKSKCLSIICGS